MTKSTKHDSITDLVKIVKNAETEVEADKRIADLYDHLSTRSASLIRMDLQDFIDGQMTESHLSYSLVEFGI